MHRWGSGDLSTRTVAVQGVGKVGMGLVERLSKLGANTIVSDINQGAVERAVRESGSIAVAADEIVDAECDIFAPCAMGPRHQRAQRRRTALRRCCWIREQSARNRCRRPTGWLTGKSPTPLTSL